MTAVEQLIYDLRNIDMSIFNDEHCKKYLEMEKQQIIDAAERWKGTKFAEQYYNETYAKISTPMLDRLKAHLDSITPEQFDKEIDDIIKNDDSVQMLCEDCGMEECECGLTPDELIIKDMHNQITSSQTEISDEGIDKFESFLDREIQLKLSPKDTIERIKWYYQKYFKSKEISDEEIEKWVASTPYYGHCTPEYKEGLDEGAKWYREQLKGGNK